MALKTEKTGKTEGKAEAKPVEAAAEAKPPKDAKPKDDGPKPLDGSPVKTTVAAKPPAPWKPKTVAEHNAWVESLSAPK